MPDSDPAHVSAREFRELFRSLSTWGQWGELDERGALNYITVDRVAEAARLLLCPAASRSRSAGRWTPDASRAQPVSRPGHHMTVDGASGRRPRGDGSLRQGLGRGRLSRRHAHARRRALPRRVQRARCTTESGEPDVDTIAARTAQSDGSATDGLVGRGVLLDIPGVRGVPWLEPGEHVFAADLEAAERAHGVSVRGRRHRARAHRSCAPATRSRFMGDRRGGKAGLHPTALPFVAERGVVALGSDGNSDTAPGARRSALTSRSMFWPVNAMGLYLFDYLQLEDLVAAAERAARFEVPLRCGAASHSRRHRLAGQPARDTLSLVGRCREPR